MANQRRVPTTVGGQRIYTRLLMPLERKIHPYLPKISNKQILDAYRVLCTEQNKPHPASLRELYEEEYRALCEETEDENADFSSRRISPPKKYHMLLDSVTAVDCLTEIVTMVGFTRLQGWDGDMNSPCLAPIISLTMHINCRKPLLLLS